MIILRIMNKNQQDTEFKVKMKLNFITKWKLSKALKNFKIVLLIGWDILEGPKCLITSKILVKKEKNKFNTKMHQNIDEKISL